MVSIDWCRHCIDESRHCQYTVSINYDKNQMAIIKGVQIRMARAALNWGVRELAAAAEVTPNTISRIESGGAARTDTLERIVFALEAAGIEFIDPNGGGPGVRLRS